MQAGLLGELRSAQIPEAKPGKNVGPVYAEPAPRGGIESGVKPVRLKVAAEQMTRDCFTSSLVGGF